MSNTKASVSKAAVLARVQALIAGTQKHLPKGSVTVDGTAYTSAAIVKLLSQLVQAITALDAAQSSAKKALQSETAAALQVGPFITAYKQTIRTTFGKDASILADFGLEPPKARTKLTAQEQVVATAKAGATRQARGTTSKKQKLAVHGNVTGVSVTPVTAVAETAPQQPAPSASSAVPSGTVSK